MRRLQTSEGGFTLVELLITLVVLGAVAGSMFTLFISLVHSTVIAKRQAVALTLATNQMEYLKSLPYNSLAVAGGSIYSSSPLPATTTKTLDGVKYTITTSVSYVDDAYDGCGSYTTLALKEIYCRNYPPPSGAPATDTNPADYKILDITVTDPGGTHLAELSTQVSARVAETASTTGALFVNVIDSAGAPVSGATVNIVDNNVTPNVNLSDDSDENGIAIFYGLPPDSTGNHYVITASKSGYSTLNTIGPSGSLQPTYPNQNILTQSSSYVTLPIKLEGANSLVIETTDTSGNPIADASIYMKGGYKKYTSTSDTTYYYDNTTPCTTTGDNKTDSSGLCGVTNLVPGDYIFCGDDGATNCKAGSTSYYLAAAIPYGGNTVFNPISVPIDDSSNPPTTTFSYGGVNYLQKVRLMLTTSSTFPRVTTLSPYDVSLASGASSFTFTLSGANLSGATVKFVQGSNTYTASCTGSSTQLNCTLNMSGATAGSTQLVVAGSGGTLTIPSSFSLGGLIVTP